MASHVSDGTTTLTPQALRSYESTQAGGTVVHQVIGRSDPDATLRPAGTRTGQLQMLFTALSDAYACREMHQAAAVFTVADDVVTQINMSYVLASSGIAVGPDDETGMWAVSVSYQEIVP